MMQPPALAAVVNPLFTSILAQGLSSWSSTSQLDVRSWLQKVNQVKVSLAATDEHAMRFVAVKVDCLRSTKKVNNLLAQSEATGIFNWSSFCTSMIGEFDVTVDDFQIEMALQKMRQQPNQTLMAYAKCFENEASRCSSISSSKLCFLFAGTLPSEFLRTTAATTIASARASGRESSILNLAASLSALHDAHAGPAILAAPASAPAPRQVAPSPPIYSHHNGTRTHQQTQRWDSRVPHNQQWSSSNGASLPAHSASVSQDVRRPLPPSGCHRCGSRDHWSRNCPRAVGQTSSSHRSVNAINEYIDGESFITGVVLNGSTKAQALIDTGAQANVVCYSTIQRMWPSPPVVPCSRILYGPN
ncbi:MAG TPA: hypothetical protein V6C65_10435, partial [Allocoleopsis sp.]